MQSGFADRTKQKNWAALGGPFGVATQMDQLRQADGTKRVSTGSFLQVHFTEPAAG
jgi:hypothetical protein